MRLPTVPGPRELAALLPRTLGLLDGAERLLRDVDALLRRIEGTRAAADDVVARVSTSNDRAGAVLDKAAEAVARAELLLEGLEPPVTRLLPVLDRLAETTDPQEVDAVVALIDLLPGLVGRVETDLLPVLETLKTVSPDLHDLLDTSKELNEMLAKLPGMGRVKKRVEEKQEARSE
jgi:hypothetical protein